MHYRDAPHIFDDIFDSLDPTRVAEARLEFRSMLEKEFHKPISDDALTAFEKIRRMERSAAKLRTIGEDLMSLGNGGHVTNPIVNTNTKTALVVTGATVALGGMVYLASRVLASPKKHDSWAAFVSTERETSAIPPNARGAS